MADGAVSQARPRRRILLIERTFQIRFIAKMTAVVVLGTALTGGLLYILANQEFGRAFYSAHYQARSSWELLLPAVLVASFVSMALVAAAATFLTLYSSHKIGGPLYRFRANLQAIGDGDLTLVTRLREGDELQGFTEAMNEMTQRLREKVGEARDAAEDVRVALAEAKGVAEAGGALTLEKIRPLEEAVERLHRALGRFRV
ncbi:hypothetical protein [Deferrisoma palaeochoriense]